MFYWLLFVFETDDCDNETRIQTTLVGRNGTKSDEVEGSQFIIDRRCIWSARVIDADPRLIHDDMNIGILLELNSEAVWK